MVVASNQRRAIHHELEERLNALFPLVSLQIRAGLLDHQSEDPVVGDALPVVAQQRSHEHGTNLAIRSSAHVDPLRVCARVDRVYHVAMPLLTVLATRLRALSIRRWPVVVLRIRDPELACPSRPPNDGIEIHSVVESRGTTHGLDALVDPQHPPNRTHDVHRKGHIERIDQHTPCGHSRLLRGNENQLLVDLSVVQRNLVQIAVVVDPNCIRENSSPALSVVSESDRVGNSPDGSESLIEHIAEPFHGGRNSR